MTEMYVPAIFVAVAAMCLGYMLGSFRGYKKGVEDMRKIYGDDE